MKKEQPIAQIAAQNELQPPSKLILVQCKPESDGKFAGECIANQIIKLSKTSEI